MAVLVATAVVGAAAACGQPTPAPAPSVEATVEVPLQPTLAPLDTAAPPALPPTMPPPVPGPSEGFFDPATALTGARCALTGGTWSFSGTLTNADTSPHTFTVAVSLLRAKDLSQAALTEIAVTVPAGGSAPVEAKDFSSDATPGLQCVSGATVKGP